VSIHDPTPPNPPPFHERMMRRLRVAVAMFVIALTATVWSCAEGSEVTGGGSISSGNTTTPVPTSTATSGGGGGSTGSAGSSSSDDSGSPQDSGGACAVDQCPDPPYSGLEKCCTDDGQCGFKSGSDGTCYNGDSGNSSGGNGGQGGN
jgi:hypothetical protein